MAKKVKIYVFLEQKNYNILKNTKVNDKSDATLAKKINFIIESWNENEEKKS
ncbi:hypothetical protein S100390_v1c03950 [Spiroplasma sp. NBRC 100390]|uniref:hypothetical protein n=1 Tax=unclassified Spiroplasma TaxID=2637901 RepID=UPI00089283AA|nr:MULTISPECIES: hypothetical protein [unclassified Spiroplasma]AOX43738.1 hypothetical protein STU14_v1c03950 [Spiroplasma sp. TU-14]APE13208.1 hypothetical protein S100390_v1c03950 [Spiroplasma sp. NBRC 100390]